ncbi:MAG: response regulator transcription factor [Acidimicrobiales bacterium]
MGKIQIVLADDSLLIREGVAAILAAIDGVELLAECGDLESLEAAVIEFSPDVVITDIRMPPTHTDEGIAAAIRFRDSYPSMGVIVLSQYSEPEYVMALFEHGSSGLGYLLKNRIGDVVEFQRAIKAVLAGDSAVDSAIIDVLVKAQSQSSSAVDRLTPRESEVLALIAEGMNNDAIAAELVLSSKAVAKHINSIFSKLGVSEEADIHRRVKAVLLWLTAD